MSGWGQSVWVSYLSLGRGFGRTWRGNPPSDLLTRLYTINFVVVQQIPGVSLWWKAETYFCVSSLSPSLPPLFILRLVIPCMFYILAPVFIHSTFCRCTVFYILRLLLLKLLPLHWMSHCMIVGCRWQIVWREVCWIRATDTRARHLPLIFSWKRFLLLNHGIVNGIGNISAKHLQEW